MISEDEIRYYRQLDERQQRIFLGMKAKSLGVSGVRMVSETFGVNAKTVRKGKQELSALPDSPPRRVREAGGGAKKKLGAHPEWLEAFDRVVEGSTAGLPQDCAVRWTHLGRRQIVGLLAAEGQSVSSYHVAQMLALRGLKKRKLLKMNDLKKCEQREEQFEKIGCYRQCFTGLNLPVLSIDTKKKEMLGNFHRAGECYSSASRRVNDHDFPSFSDGRIVPHGIHDVNANRGYGGAGPVAIEGVGCLLAADRWQQIAHRQGTKGPLVRQAALVKVWLAKSGREAVSGPFWLLVSRESDGTQVKFSRFGGPIVPPARRPDRCGRCPGPPDAALFRREGLPGSQAERRPAAVGNAPIPGALLQGLVPPHRPDDDGLALHP